MARQKMGRLGTAEEIAALVTYLAADEVIQYAQIVRRFIPVAWTSGPRYYINTLPIFVSLKAVL